MNSEDSDFEENPPDPAATIEALRSLGYSTESAIADLIDNSVAAGANNVEVQMHWDGANTWCAIIDDGSGMNLAELRKAMRIGARDPLHERESTDLGRFGMGLKTASFSQARELTVATRQSGSGSILSRTWDLDHVRAVGRWEMTLTPKPQVGDVITTGLRGRRGTIVVWRNLTNILESDEEADDSASRDDFFRATQSVSWHLGMTFGRLIESGRLNLTVNGQVVELWDPFESTSSFTQVLPEETLEYKGHKIVVRGYVLPHETNLSESERIRAAGPSGWNNHQGFYVYRRDRVISAGDWLSLELTRNDNFNLARLSIDVPPELDHEWNLDVKKTSVIPPRAVRRDLKRIAEVTRRRAKRVYTSRGAEVKPRNGRAMVETVWRQLRSNTDLTFRINRSHPLVESVLEGSGPMKRSVENMLRVIEETIPIPYLPVSRSSERAPLDTESAEKLYELAEQIYEVLLTKYPSRSQAIEKLKRTEPFDSHPEIIERIVGKN